MIETESLLSMINIINDRRSWISARQDERPMQFLDIVNGYMHLTYGRAILLTSYRPSARYKSGHQWRISEYKISQAVLRLSLMDIRLLDRLRTGRLLTSDVENIILLASDNIIHLQLDDVGFFDE